MKYAQATDWKQSIDIKYNRKKNQSKSSSKNFFSISVFFLEYTRLAEQQFWGGWEGGCRGGYLFNCSYCHPPHRQLCLNQANTAESSRDTLNKNVCQNTFIKGRSCLVKFGNTEEHLNLNILWTFQWGTSERRRFYVPHFFLPHSLENFLIYVMCYQLEKIENKSYKYKYQSMWNWQSILTQMNSFEV